MFVKNYCMQLFLLLILKKSTPKKKDKRYKVERNILNEISFMHFRAIEKSGNADKIKAFPDFCIFL